MKRTILAMILLLAAGVQGAVTETATWVKHDCDGGTTGFTFSFPIGSAADLEVWLVDTSRTPYAATPLAWKTHYTVTVPNNLYPAARGTVTTVSTYSAAYDLIITTDIALTQSAVLSSTWTPATIERTLDKLMRIAMEKDREISTCIRNPPTISYAASTTLPELGSYGYLYRDAVGAVSLVSSIQLDQVVDYNLWTSAIPTYGVGQGPTAGVYQVLNDLWWKGADGVAKNISGLLDEDNMASNDATLPASQQSIKAFITSGTVTMSNKTLTAPVLTGAVINEGVWGTAILDQDDMASNSMTKLATQQSIKAYVDAKGVFASGATVFNATLTAASTFQDLDLSAVVGANVAWVYLEVYSNGTGGFACRPKGYGGATFAHHTNAEASAQGAGVHAANFMEGTDYRYVTCITDSSGVIQIGYDDNVDTITIKVVSYIR